MGINLAGGQSIAVARAPIDMVQYTSPRTPAVLPYQYEVPAEMRTLRGARSYEVNPAMVKTAPYVIANLYGYKTGPVLFKPTKAAAKPFRLDPTAALSYFVSGNTAFPEDKGFALKPCTGVRFENNGVLLEGTTALAQGNYFFTDTDGKETKVEYTFGYFRDSEGQLRINLHHSSLPFKPA